MNINHISVSRKKCFDQCAQLYKYRYHLKIPAPGPEPFYFVYGTIVHKIAEVYVEEKTKRPIGDVALDVLHGKIQLKEGQVCPPLQDEYKKKLQKHLKAIQNLTGRIGSDGMTEYEFRYDLDPPHKRHIIGFIDRLIIKGEGESKKAFIIDYKTTKKGKFRVNSQTVLEDLQLRCYARVVQREFQISPANIKAALYYLDGENLIAAQYNEESLERVEKELKDGFVRIENSDPDRVWGNVGWHCKNCDYATMCHFYKPQGQMESKWSGDPIELGHDDAWA
jgi:CRISPR/Cas system-associated exonuclease Cas4 (RecB family)